MKNIHVLSTDKPSRLSILNNGKLNFGAEFISSSNSKAQNIYIISDEEIKEGDWFYLDDAIIVAKYIDVKPDKEAQKIILTTDQDLIKDGVQAIDDDFLEWFVKNPSCEFVEVKSWIKTYEDGSSFDRMDYEIIIPKEETLEEAAIIRYGSDPYLWAKQKERDGFIEGGKWQQERSFSKEEVLDMMFEVLNQKREECCITHTRDSIVRKVFEKFKKK